MPIIRCPGCERSIDIDTTDVEDVQIGEDLVIMCVPCAMKHEEDALSEGRALAGQHQDPEQYRAEMRDAGRGHLLPEHWEE